MIRIVVVFCILTVVPCILGSCKERQSAANGGKLGTTCQAGEHKVIILETFRGIDTTRESSVETSPDGTTTFAYHSANLNMDIKIEAEVLTVADTKYIIPRKDDTITITDGRVEINGQPAQAEK